MTRDVVPHWTLVVARQDSHDTLKGYNRHNTRLSSHDCMGTAVTVSRCSHAELLRAKPHRVCGDHPVQPVLTSAARTTKRMGRADA